jgi:hypothetical protein
MAAEVVFSISASPIIHSQLVLPTREVPPVALIEDWESLWARVNRICDQYMPRPFASDLWRIAEDNVPR